MPLSTHYYVLSLGSRRNMLFEAFRDSLIRVDNRGFPVVASDRHSSPGDPDPRFRLAREVERCFGQYYRLDPLGLVVVGDAAMQSAFRSVTAANHAVIARIDGDHTETTARDLGQIVWPVVKESLSGLAARAMRELEASARCRQVVYGLDAVARLANRGVGTTLLVEEDYRFRGSLGGPDRGSIISRDVDVRDTMDDAVDAVTERVLRSGGNVVFLPGGALADWERIAVLLNHTEGPPPPRDFPAAATPNARRHSPRR